MLYEVITATDYRDMIIDTLYHPPHIDIHPKKTAGNTLYLSHRFEEKPLVKEFISNTMMGIEYLWGGPVELETSEPSFVAAPTVSGSPAQGGPQQSQAPPRVKWQRVLYTMKDRKLSRRFLYVMEDV